MSLTNDINSLVTSVNLELYDASIVSEGEETIYRVSVISPEMTNGKRSSVSLDSCVELTHLISPLLDVSPPVSGDYRLEVGSPGIERKITTIKHFELSLGEKISILANEKKKYRGTLVKIEGSKIFLSSEEEIFEVLFNDIVKAKTYFEW